MWADRTLAAQSHWRPRAAPDAGGDFSTPQLIACWQRGDGGPSGESRQGFRATCGIDEQLAERPAMRISGLKCVRESLLPPRWGSITSHLHPRLTPLRQAQGRLWAAFLRRFAAENSHCDSTATLKFEFSRTH